MTSFCWPNGSGKLNYRRCLGYIKAILLSLVLHLALGHTARATPQWLTLPPTPSLPKADRSGTAPVDGIKLWYACYGAGPEVMLLHGGLANANYWGLQVPPLARHYHVCVMDSRGHGRSTRNADPFGYDLMASDVLGLMDFLHVKRATLVGWSDGAIIGLDIAIHHPDRLTGLFAFAANSDPSGAKDMTKSPVGTAYIARAAMEYHALSPTPDAFQPFLSGIEKMWATQPHFSQAQMHAVTVPTWIVDADHDEAIERANTLLMADAIPGAGLLIQPQVSHFSFIQDPAQFTADVLRFLARFAAPQTLP